MIVNQAYRFALDPTPAQERVFWSHAGAARVAFNWGLARVKAVMDQRNAERTYGVAEPDVTPSIGWNLPALRRAWNQAKGEVPQTDRRHSPVADPSRRKRPAPPGRNRHLR